MRLVIVLSCVVAFLFANNLKLISLESDFKQIIISPENTKLIYTGHFYLRNDNQALWVYKTPIIKSIYFKDNKIAILEPELEQITFSKISKTINLNELFNNATKISSNLYKAVFDEITYKITVENGTPNIIKYTDKLENNVTLSFSNSKKNLIISDDIFKLNYPSHYDIINH